MRRPPRITWRGGQLRAIKSRHFKYYVSNRSTVDTSAVAKAREEIINFILIYKGLRAISLRQSILSVSERIRERRIPPHLIDAVYLANARPNQIGSTSISEKTLFRWARKYKLSNGQRQALAPLPSKTMYANKNCKPKRYDHD